MDIKTRLLVGLLKMTQFPQIPSEPKAGKWYGIPLKGCVSSDGKEAHAGFRKGTENKLVILLFGGGVSWNEFMAARWRLTAPSLRCSVMICWKETRPTGVFPRTAAW